MPDSLYTLTLESPFAEVSDAYSRRYDYYENILAYATEPEEVPTERTYGVELEFNPRGGRQKFVESINAVFAGCPHFFVKNDGSISDDGGEIVTTPRTLSAHNEMFSLVEQHAAGFRASAVCGFHVHAPVPNNLFTTARVYQFIMSPALAAFVTAIAQRHPNEYCYRAGSAFIGLQASAATKWASLARADHSGAFTFSGKGTVEFRMFAARTRRYLLSSYVEFADAILTFCTTRSIPSHPGLALDGVIPVFGAFIVFVLADAARYPNLAYRLKLPAMRAVIDQTLKSTAAFDNSLFRKLLTVDATNGSM